MAYALAAAFLRLRKLKMFRGGLAFPYPKFGVNEEDRIPERRRTDMKA